MSNITEPVLQSFSKDQFEQPASQEVFFEEFKKLLCGITQRLQEHPVIVAHSENTFNGSGVRKLLSNKFELDKVRSTRFASVILSLLPQTRVSAK